MWSTCVSDRPTKALECLRNVGLAQFQSNAIKTVAIDMKLLQTDDYDDTCNGKSTPSFEQRDICASHGGIRFFGGLLPS